MNIDKDIESLHVDQIAPQRPAQNFQPGKTREILRLLAVSVFVILPFAAQAQWTHTNWPYGGTVNAFAVSGTNLFAGTGGSGVFLTTNNGSSWTPANSGWEAASINCLAVSGTNLFAGGWGTGVILSTNTGATWTQVASGLTNTDVFSLVINGTNLFAGTNGGGVFLSANNGTSWTAVNSGLTNMSVKSLAVSGTNLFAGTDGGGVFLSTNSGTSWIAVNSGLTKTTINSLVVSGTNLFAGTDYGGVFLSTNSGTSWAAVDTGMGTPSVKALLGSGTNLFAGTWGGGAFLSTNNGTNWAQVNSGLTNTVVFSLAVSGTNLYAGTNGGGIFLSTNNGTSWSPVNSGLANTDASCFAVSGANLFAGTYGGGVFRSTDNGTSWIQVISSDLAMCVKSLAVSGTNLFWGSSGGLFLSTNNGTSWTTVVTGLSNKNVWSLAVNGVSLFAGTWGGGVFLSTNNGTSWTAVNSGLTDTIVKSLAVSGANLFAGTANGGVFLSTNNGTSWTAVNSGLTDLNVNCFAVSGTNLFDGNWSGVFLSTNNGTSWSAVNTGLTNTGVYALAVSGNNLFGGTYGGGVFVSANNGTNWTPISSGLTNTTVLSLGVSGTNLFAGTRGGGVFVRNMPPSAPQNLTAMAANGQVTLRWNRNTEADFARYRIYRGTSPNPISKVDSTSIGNLADTVKVSAGLTNSTTYYFRVTAVDSAGYESGYSSEVNAVPRPYQIGDYASSTSGNWGTLTTWTKWNGSNWGDTVAAAPTSLDDVWIRTGNTVVVDVSGKSCRNLFVDNGATLFANSVVTSPRYIQVYGSTVTNLGTFGGASDALGLRIYAARYSTVTLTGTSLFNISRIQPATPAVTIVFDAIANINYAGASGTGSSGLFNNGQDSITYTVNAGKTLAMAPLSYISVGTSGTSDPSPGYDLTLNVYGTLTTGPNAQINLRNVSGKNSKLNVFGGGSLTCGGTLNLFGAGTSTVTDNGTITINGAVDFSDPTRYISGSGGFVLGAGSTAVIGASAGLDPVNGAVRTTSRTFSPLANYTFVGSSASLSSGSDMPSHAGRLTINDTSGIVTLTNSLTVDSLLTFIAGKLALGANTITVDNIVGASSSSYVVTNGSGVLTKRNVGSGPLAWFPIGTSSSYNPVNLSNTGTADNFSARVQSSFDVLPPDTSKVVKRQWMISEASPGGSNVSIGLQWNASEEGSLFNRLTSINLYRYTEGAWSPIAASDTGSGPYAAMAIGCSSLSAFVIGNTIGIVPAIPGNLIATPGNGQVTLGWNKNAEADFLKYRVYMGTDSSAVALRDSSGTSITDTTKTITGLANGTKYYFRVSALDSSRVESGQSVAASATPMAENILRLSPYAVSGQYLNDQIVADTVANGKLQNRVYVLQRGGVYRVDAQIQNDNWTLRIRGNDSTTSHKADVFLYPSVSGVMPGRFINVTGDVELRNLVLSAYYEPLDTNLRSISSALLQIPSTSSGCRIVVDSCILTNTNGNHIRTDGPASVIKITNTIFANLGYLGKSNLGAGKGIDLRENSIDSLFVQNCTFVNSQDRIIRHLNLTTPPYTTSPIQYLLFDHNTLINGMSFHGLLSLGNIGSHAIITNNLFLDAFALGNDTDYVRQAEFTPSGESDLYGKPRMNWILSETGSAALWTVSHNYYGVSDSGQAFYDQFASAGVTGEGSPLTWFINKKIGSDSTVAFKKIRVGFSKTPALMTNLMRWYRSPSGGNKTKNTPGAWVYGNVNVHPYSDPYDYDRKGYSWLQDSLNCSYLASESPSSSDGKTVGDTRWNFNGVLPAVAAITFQVDVRPAEQWGRFNPAAGDSLLVRGSVSSLGWLSNSDVLTDPNNDSIYTITKDLTVTGPLQYKYVVRHQGADFWEFDSAGGNGNRTYQVVAGAQTLPMVSYNALPPYQPFSGEYVRDAAATGLWHMNEDNSSFRYGVWNVGGGSQIFFDQSGNGNHGYRVGTPTLTAGRFGNAYTFNGSTDYIDLAKSLLSASNPTFTAEAWVKVNQLTSWGQDIFSNTTSMDAFLSISTTGRLQVGVRMTDGAVRIDSSQAPLPVGTWMHCAMAYDYSNGKLLGYFSGRLVVNKDVSGLTPWSNRVCNSMIGTGFNNLYGFNGAIDEVRLSNRVRTPQEFDLQLPPKSLIATFASPSINLSWQTGGGAVGCLRYRIYRGVDSTSMTVIDSTLSSSYVNSGLSQGTYFYRISAVDLTGFESWRSYAASATVPAGNLPPLTPAGLIATQGSGQIGLKWNPNTESDFFKYYVYIGTDSVTMSVKDSTAAGNLRDTTRIVAQLTNGTKYYFRVSALDSARVKSGQSVAVSAVPSILNASREYNPDVNTLLLMHMDELAGTTVGDAGNLSNRGTAAGTTIVQGKFVNARSFNGTSDLVDVGATLTNSTLGSFTVEAWISINALPSDVAYVFYDGSDGEFDLLVSSTSNAGTDLQLNNNTWYNCISSQSLGLNKWIHVAGMYSSTTNVMSFYLNGVLASQLNVPSLPMASPAGEFHPTVGAYSGNTNTHVKYFSGIIDEIRVSDRVRSPQEFNLQLPPLNLTADTSGLTVNLVWQNGGGAIPLMKYMIYRGADSTNVILVDSSIGTSKSNNVPSPGTYYYRIASVDSTRFEGARSYAAVARPTTAPAIVPPVLTGPADASSGVSINPTLTWNAASGATSYSIQVSTDGSFASTLYSASGITGTSKAISGLNYLTKYYWRMNATNGSVTSAWSTSSSFTTILAPPALSGPLNNATNISTNPTLLWVASGGATGYRVQMSLSSSFAPTVYDVSGITGTSTAPTGLSNLTKYYWRVCANSSAGASDWSATWNFTTTDVPPSPPSNLVLTPQRPTQIRLNWADNSSNEDGFHIERRLSGSGVFNEVAAVGGGATTYLDTALAEWTYYLYRVRAYNTAGNSSYTNTDSVRTFDVTPPPSPINADVTPKTWTNTNRFKVTWTNPSDASGIAKLFYRCDSPPSALVPGDSMLVVDSTAVNIAAPSVGVHLAYLYLQDIAGNKNPASAVTVTMKFDNLPPTISHDSLGVPTFSTASPQDIAIAAMASDIHSGLKSLQLMYRCADDPWSEGSTINYAPGGGSLMISAPFISAASDCGVDYKIVAKDSANNSATSPTHSLSIVIAQKTPRADSNGTPVMQTSVDRLPSSAPHEYAYRLFSVPLQLDNPTPRYVLETETGLGTYDNAKWRFFRMHPTEDKTQEYDEFADEATITPGAGFFLVLKTGSVLKAGTGKIVKTEDINKTGIQLKQGHNFVGNPFNFEIPISSLVFSNGELLSHAGNYWSYVGEGGTDGGWYRPPATIRPWEGILVYTAVPRILIFNVADRPVSPKVVSSVSAKTLETSESSTIIRSWALRIIAQRKDNGLTDSENLFGIEADATDSLDLIDLYQPPLIGDKGLALYSITNGEKLTHDYREPGKDGYVWDLRVKTIDNAAAVTLSFEGLDETSSDVFLVDVDSKITYRPKYAEKIEVNSGYGGRNFRLIVGSVSFAEENSMGVDIIPKKFMLYQNYPNPFNPQTTIRYTIPNADRSHRVVLNIYNILGNEIVTLVEGEQPAGYYEVRFDGHALSSGTYFCRLRIDGGGQGPGYTDVKKLILIK